VKEHQAIYPVATMCRVFRVSPSGFYAWRERPPSRRAQRDAEILQHLRVFHARSDGTYGAPRLIDDLRDIAIRVGKKRVARVMRLGGLMGVSRRRAVRTTRRGPDEHAAADLVQRQFTATGPDQLWVADITYIPTWANFLFLAVVIDAWSRRVVGWAMASHLKTDLVLAALNMAITQRRPVNVIHHSDHGCQYTALAFGDRCQRMGVRPSRGTVGDAYDNAMAESFFATLECERLDRRTYRSHTEARLDLFQYIEGWYNPHRRHSGIGNQSPINFERLQAQAA
jgi:putative transposase